MIKKKVMYNKWFHMMCLGVAFMFLGINNVSAIPTDLTNWSVGYTDSMDLYPGITTDDEQTVFATYTFDADQFPQQAAFCVEAILVDKTDTAKYELVGIDTYFGSMDDDTRFLYAKAAYIADFYFHDDTFHTNQEWSQSVAQLAIWTILFEVEAVQPELNDLAFGISQAAIPEGFSESGPTNSNDFSDFSRILVARSTGANNTPHSQDFFVSAVAVPEPTTILLMGLGLIGLFGIRKRIVTR